MSSEISANLKTDSRQFDNPSLSALNFNGNVSILFRDLELSRVLKMILNETWFVLRYDQKGKMCKWSGNPLNLASLSSLNQLDVNS